MDSKVCVTCGNKNPVNGTNNRLVTENCGHVKCMQCLLEEKSGCVACKASSDGVENGTQVNVYCNGKEKDRDKDNQIGDKVIESSKEQNKKPDLSHIVEIQEDGQKKYLCKKCDSTFVARSTKAYHAYCLSDKTPYVCLDCNKKFANVTLYEYHKRSHHSEERPFKCDECSAGFIQKSKLKRHIEIRHSVARKYAYKGCKKSFTTEGALSRHMRLHSGARPFACPECTARFADSSNFRRHLQRHRQQKDMPPIKLKPRPHHCPRCGLSFSARKDMRRHQHVHTERKTWPCPLCPSFEPRFFRRKDNLLRHIRAHSPTGAPPKANPRGAPTLVDQELEDLQNGKSSEAVTTTQTLEMTDKNNLKILNPLPPLPEEEIRKHMYTDRTKDNNKSEAIEKRSDAIVKSKPEAMDKSYIIEANNARESVIVAKVPEKRVPSPVIEYVHKIRRANSKDSGKCKEVPLPPIDESKFYTILTENLDIGPLPKNTQMLKNILHDKSEKQDEEKTPKVHWRKKRLTDNE